MAIYTNEHIVATIHDFKSNISRYIRLLEQGKYRAVIVRRYDRTIGVFISNNSIERWEERRRIEKEERDEARRRKDTMLIAIQDTQQDPNRVQIPDPNEAGYAE